MSGLGEPQNSDAVKWGTELGTHSAPSGRLSTRGPDGRGGGCRLRVGGPMASGTYALVRVQAQGKGLNSAGSHQERGETLRMESHLLFVTRRVSLSLGTVDIWDSTLLCCGGVLCFVGCLTASLAPTH